MQLNMCMHILETVQYFSFKSNKLHRKIYYTHKSVRHFFRNIIEPKPFVDRSSNKDLFYATSLA